MTAVLNKPPCTHREETPVRECARCGAYLRSFTGQKLCDPCSTPREELVDVWDSIADATFHERRLVFEALQRAWESMS